MQKLKPQSKKSKSRFRKAALVFGLAGATFLAGYWNWKCDRTERKPVSMETIQRSSNKARETKTKEVMAKLEKVPSAVSKKKSEVDRKANEVLMKVVEEFPYEVLDCKLKPLIADDELDEEALEALDCRRYGPLKEWCPKDLYEGIIDLVDENNVEGLLAIVKYMNSLNIEWPDETGKSLDSNLFFTYLRMRDQALYNEWENAPNRACVAQNAYAFRILMQSSNLLSLLLFESENAYLIDQTLEQLPEFQRRNAFNFLSTYFETEDFDRSEIEDFYTSLSSISRVKFIEALYDQDVNHEVWVARAEELAKYGADPELRDAMSRIAIKWKDELAKAKKELEEEIRSLIGDESEEEKESEPEYED